MTSPLTVLWIGEPTPIHSLGSVNSHLCASLRARGQTVYTLNSEPNWHSARAVSQTMSELGLPEGEAIDIVVRHKWPAVFEPPPFGNWVMMQTWDFGSLPRSWVEPSNSRIDELWTYSGFAREAFTRSGVDSGRVSVIPLGVNPDVFRPGAPRLSWADIVPASKLQLASQSRFKFLFVGGAIFRKGIDLLVEAYSRAFNASDDVCLVIKDIGATSFYRRKSYSRLL